MLLSSVSPVRASPFMKKLRECFGKAISQRLHHDSIVIIMVGLKLLRQFVRTVSDSDRKSPEVIGSAGFSRRNIVG